MSIYNKHCNLLYITFFDKIKDLKKTMNTLSTLYNIDLDFLFTVVMSLGAAAFLLMLLITKESKYLIASAPFIGVLLAIVF